MITGKKEELDEIAKSYVCMEDGGALVVAWHAGENSYVIRCGKGHFPEEVTRQPSLTQLYKQGAVLPEPIQSNVQKSIEKRAARLPKVPGAETFTGIPATDLGTGELIPLDKLQALCIYARKYGLDPARGHVCLMYGKPYITIDGYLYHAHQEQIPFSLSGHPLTVDELILRGYQEGDIGWYSKVERLDTHQVFEGYGFIEQTERTEMSKKHPNEFRYPIVAGKPGLMVIKRADWQALRRAFPIGESEEGKEG